MVYVIRYRGVLRGRQLDHWIMRAFVLATASVATGAAVGAGFGWLGSLVRDDVRAGTGAALALCGLFISAVELVRGRRVPVLQRSRETNQGWLGIGAAVGAALNGAAMGAGFATRIGYWLWYVVPVTCFLLASPGAGALVFGLYGLARAAFPVALAVNDRLRERDERHLHKLQDAMTTLVSPAATLCTIHLVAVSCAYLIS